MPQSPTTEYPAGRARAEADRGFGPAPKADVGVLLVHGIGDHAEGETLLTFGDPLVDWLREWMSGRRNGEQRGSVKVGETNLLARRTETESPAYSVIEIEQTAGTDEPQRERWLLAESWWGESVHPPGMFALLLWMFTRLPLLVLWHFFGGRRTHPSASSPMPSITNVPYRRWDPSVPDWLALAAKSLFAPLLILLMQSVVLVAAILAVVPFGVWREALLKAVRLMTLTLGDSFVLLEQDIQRAALSDRVARSLRWLQPRVDRVIVVAHSQGGAIAHEAMQHGAAPDLFISVGSGLEKLEFLRLVRSSRRGLVASTVAAPAFALGITGLLAGLIGWIDRDDYWWVLPSALAAAGYFMGYRLWDVVKQYRSDLERALASSRLARAGGVQRWCDVYATLDLVPMGRGSLLPRESHIERVELRNECSFATDHVTYFSSCCGFAAWCWMAMCAQSKLMLIDDSERLALQDLGLWHARRAFAIGFGGGLVPLAVVFSSLVFTDAMALVGMLLFDAMSTVDLHWIRRALEWLMTGLASGVGLLPGFENEPHDLLRRSRVLLTAAVSLPALALWALLIRMLWRTDGRARWRAACQGTSLLVGPRAVWLGFPMVLFWCVFAMLPLLGVMIASLSPEAFTLGSLGRAMARVGALLLAIAGLAWGLVLPALDEGKIEEHFMTRQGHFAWPFTTVFFMTILGWLARWAWSDGIGAVIIERVFSVALGACSLCWLLAIGNESLPARWQLGLLWFGALLLQFAIVSIFGYDFSNPMFLLACAVVLLTAGKLRENAIRGEQSS